MVGGGFIWSKASLLWAAVAGDGSRSSREQNSREELAWDGEQGYASMVIANELVTFVLPKRQNNALSPIIRDLFRDPHMIYAVCEPLNDRLTLRHQEFSRNSTALLLLSFFKARATSVCVSGSVEKSALG